MICDVIKIGYIRIAIKLLCQKTQRDICVHVNDLECVLKQASNGAK